MTTIFCRDFREISKALDFGIIDSDTNTEWRTQWNSPQSSEGIQTKSKPVGGYFPDNMSWCQWTLLI